MVVALGWAYVRFGGLARMQAVFYGAGAAVIGLIAMSARKLTQKTLGTDKLPPRQGSSFTHSCIPEAGDGGLWSKEASMKRFLPGVPVNDRSTPTGGRHEKRAFSSAAPAHGARCCG